MEIPWLPEMAMKCVGLNQFPILLSAHQRETKILHLIHTNSTINVMLINAGDIVTGST